LQLQSHEPGQRSVPGRTHAGAQSAPSQNSTPPNLARRHPRTKHWCMEQLRLQVSISNDSATVTDSVTSLLDTLDQTPSHASIVIRTRKPNPASITIVLSGSRPIMVECQKNSKNNNEFCMCLCCVCMFVSSKSFKSYRWTRMLRCVFCEVHSGNGQNVSTIMCSPSPNLCADRAGHQSMLLGTRL